VASGDQGAADRKEYMQPVFPKGKKAGKTIHKLPIAFCPGIADLWSWFRARQADGPVGYGVPGQRCADSHSIAQWGYECTAAAAVSLG
jgi:hypothetical protein